MAFDGIMIAGLVHELKQELLEARITKIAQPEADQLLLTIKNSKKTKTRFPFLFSRKRI